MQTICAIMKEIRVVTGMARTPQLEEDEKWSEFGRDKGAIFI